MNNQKKAELNSGEIYLDSNMENILEVPNSKKYLHKNGGFKEDDVSFVLNNAYREDKKDKVNKKLLISMDDLEDITGIKTKDSKKKLTHSEAFKEVSEINAKTAKKLGNAVKDAYTQSKESNSNYSKNSLLFNLKMLEETPNDMELFESLYKHQEKVKETTDKIFTDLDDTTDEELANLMKMKGGKLMKFDKGGHFPRVEKMIAETAKKPEWKGTNDESYREGLIGWYEDMINNPYLKEDKDELKNLLQEVKDATPPKFGKKAGILQRAIKKSFPESSEEYAKTFPLTRTALQNLYTENPEQYKAIMGREWSPNDNSVNLPKEKMEELKEAFLTTDSLGIDGLVDANFVDDEWYYRRPYFKDMSFDNTYDYNAFLDKYNTKGITDPNFDKGRGYVQVSPNLFINPKVARIEEVSNLEDYQKLTGAVKGRHTFAGEDGEPYTLENKDGNIGEYVRYVLNTGDAGDGQDSVVEETVETLSTPKPFTPPIPGENEYNQPYTALDGAGNLMTILNSMRKDDVLYDPVEVKAPDVYLNDPRPSLENNTQSYNAILDTLPGNGVGYANAANLFKTKLQQDNKVLGTYENANKNLLSKRDAISADVFNKQELLNNQARETFERKITQRDAIYDLQWNKNIDDLAQELSLNKKHNKNGSLIMSMIDYYDQTGDYNGLQKKFGDVLTPELSELMSTYAQKNPKKKK